MAFSLGFFALGLSAKGNILNGLSKVINLRLKKFKLDRKQKILFYLLKPYLPD